MINTIHLKQLAFLLLLVIVATIAYRQSGILRPIAGKEFPEVRCNPGTDSCKASLPGKGSLMFTVTTGPIHPLKRAHLKISLQGIAASHVEIEFDGTQMKMGRNLAILSGQDGKFEGDIILPICVTGAMEWKADVRVTENGQILRIPFIFDVSAR